MRTVNQIQADISKLRAELEDTKVHESKRDAACHILENLGWTHTPKFGWKKPPEVKRSARAYDAEFDHPVKAGDYVRHESGDYFYVQSVQGSRLTCRKVTRAIENHHRVNGVLVSNATAILLHAFCCKVIAPSEIKL